jgi:O-antigen/teichoic acid export membrane protein
MLEPLRNPTSWDNFRKVVVLVLILWAVSALLCIIYFFILEGRSPAPANIFRALILLVPFIAQADRRTGSSSRTQKRRQ